MVQIGSARPYGHRDKQDSPSACAAPATTPRSTTQQIPVLFFFTGLHKDYHRASDDWDKINFAVTEQILRLAYLCAAELTAVEKRPAYVQVKRPTRGPSRRRGGQARLGVSPDYAFQGQGVRVAQVSGAPARNAGMLDGDIIVQIGERQIGNMQDLRVAMTAHKPGQKVPVAVLRGKAKKRLTLTVTFGAR